MAELLKTKINKKSHKIHECSPQRCIFKEESSKDVALQCCKCHCADTKSNTKSEMPTTTTTTTATINNLTS